MVSTPLPDDLRCCPCCTYAEASVAGVRCPTDGAVLLAPRLLPVDRERLPLLGTVLAGKYAIFDVLGAGGMGVVYEAVQAPLGRIVALKVVQPMRDTRAASRARFFEEARLAAQLSGPHVVSVFDFGEDPTTGQRFMVLERVFGPTLAEELAACDRLPPERAVRIAIHVLGALAEAHAAGLVHRDVKPANVMLATGADGGDHAMILDFGVAQPSGAKPGQAGAGTPTYMAPEQVDGREVGPAADQYAVGCMLFEMLAGRRPFEGKSGWEVMSAHLNAPIPPLPDGVPSHLGPIVRRALAKSPADRFASARAFMRALDPEGRHPTEAPARSVEAMSDDPPLTVTSTQRHMPLPAVDSPARGARLGWVVGLLVLAVATALIGGGIYRIPALPDVSPAASSLADAASDEPPRQEDAGLLPSASAVEQSVSLDQGQPIDVPPTDLGHPGSAPFEEPVRPPPVRRSPRRPRRDLITIPDGVFRDN